MASPNPAVGALVVRDGVIVGRGVTAPGGRPHAEPIALAQAGEAARGATLYVTLEPCSHHGHTPPCIDAVIASGIARVVVALRDPDPRVAGRGMAALRSAGLQVVTEVGSKEAARDHCGHILRVTEGRPFVMLKMAETADGYAAAPAGQERLLITKAAANTYVHKLRAIHDAVMIGGATARADDPLLTVRLPGLEAIGPLRIVLDRQASLSPASRLATTAQQHPVLLVALAKANADVIEPLEQAGVEVCRLPGERLELGAVLRELGRRGMTRVLCEGGPRLASALLADGFVGQVALLTGPKPLHGPGLATFSPEARAILFDSSVFALEDERQLGADRLRLFGRIEAACSPDS